ncbi:aminotransferase class III-fold pyridoxal phosphate-dependent enzyme, partial [Klebsiella pneumoniae]|uniref:aminotransferase class III-fold pyridoxal phosphate-dependent enzyme n=1 Tax=Klebsiella pneumoniae TaxID=573 RepID=UPI003B5B875F
IPAPDLRRLSACQTLSDLFAADVERAMDELDERGYGCAALLVDTIFSSDGVFADPPGFLAQAVACVQARGGLFIADEVQPGFGRTGSHFWGFHRHSVQPDIVTLGKPMGNGFPMAAVITRPAILQAFSEKTEYFNTFGGNPVAAAVGLAVLEVIEQEALMNNAQRNGD